MSDIIIPRQYDLVEQIGVAGERRHRAGDGAQGLRILGRPPMHGDTLVPRLGGNFALAMVRGFDSDHVRVTLQERCYLTHDIDVAWHVALREFRHASGLWLAMYPDAYWGSLDWMRDAERMRRAATEPAPARIGDPIGREELALALFEMKVLEELNVIAEIPSSGKVTQKQLDRYVEVLMVMWTKTKLVERTAALAEATQVLRSIDGQRARRSRL